jgi:hypothetical protein
LVKVRREGFVVAGGRGGRAWWPRSAPALTVLQGRFAGHGQPKRRALYEPRSTIELVAMVGDDAGVSALATSGWTLLHLGFPDQGMARCDEAVRLANSLDTPYSLAQALVWRLALLNDRRAETMADAATDARRYCDEQGFPAMAGAATAFLGLALNDLSVILEGTGVLASTGTLLMAP